MDKRWECAVFRNVLLSVIVLSSLVISPASSEAQESVPTDQTETTVPLAAFVDTTNSVFVNAIDWLFDHQITQGCNPPANTMFCPNENVTRGQMAIFLSRAFGFPATANDYFSDDDGAVYESAANRLFEAGLTVGCAPQAYCGNDFIRRDQMAAMFARALSLPPSSTNHFDDDTGSIFEGAINRIGDAGITQGCNPPNNNLYCPGQNVTRGQMAAFIKRTVEFGGITPPPSLSTPSASGPLPNAVVEIPYSAALTVTGGTAPRTVQKISGPGWINVSSTGVVSGTPFAVDLGSANLQVRVTDADGTQATAAIPIKVTDGCDGSLVLPLAQCLALVELYKSTGGANWTDNTGWLAGEPCGNWFGVTCAGNVVGGLLLEENNLTGVLPPEIGQLTGLTSIDLHDNLIGGGLPAEMSALTALTSLRLDSNALIGGITDAQITAWASLVTLNLSSNELSGNLPAAMNGTTLGALTLLDLSENTFTSTNSLDSLATITTLQTLHLNENGFSGDLGVSPIWTGLTALTSLDLAENTFTGVIPATLPGGLTVLDLSENQMGGVVPDSITGLSLIQLFLFGNTGCFTASEGTTTFVAALDPLWNVAEGCPPPP